MAPSRTARALAITISDEARPPGGARASAQTDLDFALRALRAQSPRIVNFDRFLLDNDAAVLNLAAEIHRDRRQEEACGRQKPSKTCRPDHAWRAVCRIGNSWTRLAHSPGSLAPLYRIVAAFALHSSSSPLGTAAARPLPQASRVTAACQRAAGRAGAQDSADRPAWPLKPARLALVAASCRSTTRAMGLPQRKPLLDSGDRPPHAWICGKGSAASPASNRKNPRVVPTLQSGKS